VPSPYSTRQIKKTFARLPLAAQFVLALTALIGIGFVVAVGIIWEGEYEETHGAFMPLLIGGAVVIASFTAFLLWRNWSRRADLNRGPADYEALGQLLCWVLWTPPTSLSGSVVPTVPTEAMALTAD
jgi:hypothetical protein